MIASITNITKKFFWIFLFNYLAEKRTNRMYPDTHEAELSCLSFQGVPRSVQCLLLIFVNLVSHNVNWPSVLNP